MSSNMFTGLQKATARFIYGMQLCKLQKKSKQNSAQKSTVLKTNVGKTVTPGIISKCEV